ncbi:MAG: acylneuraminate cytidylyltransferase family protein [Acidobacteriota bacterium]|nr:MAG: acylneuraminate cytidylyltransferase family protein [Acidobacteriota bacterium]
MSKARFRILGIIPARGGSKGVPRKNLRPLAGKPLIEYTFEAALAATRLSRVILTTEDEEIAETGRRAGIEVPFLRPESLALDETPMLPVIRHAVNALEETGDRFDAICLLQPTTPLRRAEDIDACVGLIEEHDADSVISMLPVPAEFNPHWVWISDAEGYLKIATGEESPIPRRQELPPAWHREGSVYVTRRDILIERNSFYGARMVGYMMDPEKTVNIDTFEDWARAEQMIEAKRIES